jgi:dienelactone hydrolase
MHPKPMVDGRFTMTRSLLVALFVAAPAYAALVTKNIAYQEGKAQLEGVLIYDDAVKTPRPGLVVVPNWLGINEANVKQAQGLAGTKYVLFVADIYGKASRPKNQDEAGKLAGQFKGDRRLMRARVMAALEALKKQPGVDTKKLGAFGFCFGGTAALELARSGAPLNGVVALHAGLDSPTPDDAKNIKGKVLALQGADDPFVPQKDVDAFSNEMRNAKVDWQLVQFGNTVHSYTDVDAHMEGKAEYTPASARRAYAMMDAFWDEAFTAAAPAK